MSQIKVRIRLFCLESTGAFQNYFHPQGHCRFTTSKQATNDVLLFLLATTFVLLRNLECVFGIAADIITAIEYNKAGDWMAAADKGGRVVIFRKNNSAKSKSSRDSLTCIPHFQFQAFEVEFDFLKSLDIETKINKIRFYEIPNKLALFTANDRTIKFWKLSERSEHDAIAVKALKQGKGLQLPRKKRSGPATSATTCRVYNNAHAYHINSLDICNDAATFLSADDLRINMWNIERSDTAFNLVDFKPSNMTELNEVITCTRYFPQQSNLFHFSTSKGILRVSDLRESACISKYSKTFKDHKATSNGETNGAYTELISAITDVKLSQSERYFAVRDYMTVKIWDMKMERKPVTTITVHDHLEPHLAHLYSSEAIFDKFEVSFSPGDEKILTGSYNNKFYIYDVNNPTAPIAEASTPDFITDADSDSGDPLSFNPSKRNLHYSYHPSGDVVAVAGLAGLHLFCLSL